jgi:(p)ppGpp synthase/HD superfamily hydrolase
VTCLFCAINKTRGDISLLTERFDEAFHYAHRLHRTQTRKGTPIPYISHLMTVAALVVEHGGNEDQAIAGLLHDAAEDQGGAETLAHIRNTFGDPVAAIVSDCTDAWTEPKPEWRPRKEAYLAIAGFSKFPDTQCSKNGLLFYHLVGAGEQREEEIRGPGGR